MNLLIYASRHQTRDKTKMNGFEKGVYIYTEFTKRESQKKSTDSTWANNNHLKIDWLSFSIQTVQRFIVYRTSADSEIVLRLPRWNGSRSVFVCNSMQILTSLHVHYHLFMKIVFICLVFKCEFVNLDHFFDDLFMDTLCHRSHLPSRNSPYISVFAKQNKMRFIVCSLFLGICNSDVRVCVCIQTL